MALKFRRGTTAQKSGSLAFGEPYVNTTLGTLQIGLDSGDITLATQGTASSGQFGAISGSSLEISGNASIGGNLTLGGNITIGDQSSDTVVVSANLSSSLIPKDNDAFDIGIPSKRYKTIYAQNISASLITIESGSWSELQLKNTDRGISYHLQNTAGANFSIHNDVIGSSVFRIDSGSTLAQSHVHIFSNLYVSTGSLFVGESIIASTGSFEKIIATSDISGSIVGIGNVTNYSGSVNSKFIATQNITTNLNAFTASADTKFSTLQTYTASVDSKILRIQESTASLNSFSSSENTKSATLALYTASVDTKFTTLQTLTASMAAQVSRLQESTASLNAFSASENTKSATLQTYTASVDTKFTTLQTYTASVDSKILRIQESTASLNAFSASENTKSETLRLYTASIDTKFTTLQTLTASVQSQLTDIQGYTSSLKAAITASGVNVTINGDTTVKGNFFVQGTQTVVDSTTVNIADNILVLNAAGTSDGGLVVRDATGGTTTSGSFLYDVTNDFWKAGRLGSESQILVAGGMGVVSGSAQIVGVLSNLNTYTSSQDTKNNTLQSYTASIDTKFTTIQSLTASNVSRLTNLESATASLLIETSNLELFTSSINTTIKTKLDTDGVISSSLQLSGRTIPNLSGSFTGSYTGSFSGSFRGPLIGVADYAATVATVTTNTTTDTTLYPLFSETQSPNTYISLRTHASGSFFYNGVTRQVNAEGFVGGIFATNGVVSGSSQVASFGYSTTGSNTFIGNQTIIGSGTGFAAYISTSVNDATLGLDTTANVNALYFLKNGEKNFEVSYDTTNANGIFRLLPYDNNSFFEIGNPSNSGADYVFISEPTYGNVLIGPGIGNGVSSLGGSTPATDKVQIAGNMFVSGAIRANSFTGSIAATNGVVSGSSQVIGILSSLNSYTGSNDTTNTTQNNRLSRLEESTSSLNAFSASENSKAVTLALYTASVDTKFSTLGLYTASVDTKFSTLQSLTASNSTRFQRIEESTSSLNAFSASENTKSETLRLYTASVDTKFTTLASYTASLETKNSTLALYTASNDTKWSTLGSLSGSFARTNSTNIFTGNQTITGSLFITQDLIVGGSSSIQNISSSRLDIGDNIIQLNVNNPVVRFGGIAVFDSGSAGGSGSFLYDSVEDEFIFVHRGNGTNVTSSHFLMGPETIDNLGNETYLTNNRIPKGTGKEHLNDSNITDTGTLITLGSNTVVNGTFVASGTSLVSASAQINYTQLSGISANIISASTDSSNVDFIISGGSITANLFGGVVSGSSQITAGSTTNFATDVKTQLNTNTVVSSSAQINVASTTGDIALGSRTSGNYVASLVAGTNITLSNNSGEGATPTIGLTNNAITIAGTSTSLGGTITAEQIRTAIGTVVTGSSQIDHNATTNYSANRHIDHTAVSITAGSGLTGGGDISTTRTISIANLGVTDAMLAGSISNGKLTNSTITIAGQSTALGSSVTAETIRTAIGTVVTGSAQIAIASTSGFGTYLNQAVLSTSSPTFAGLTINGAITATGDITAYYSSDKRYKNNIQPITNALAKVRTLNGVTWEWNDDVNEVTKAAPKTGLIAQEVQSVLPEVVKEKEDGYLGLDYAKMMGLMVEAIKEQQLQIEKLQLEVADLKKQKGL